MSACEQRRSSTHRSPAGAPPPRGKAGRLRAAVGRLQAGRRAPLVDARCGAHDARRAGSWASARAGTSHVEGEVLRRHLQNIAAFRPPAASSTPQGSHLRHSERPGKAASCQEKLLTPRLLTGRAHACFASCTRLARAPGIPPTAHSATMMLATLQPAGLATPLTTRAQVSTHARLSRPALLLARRARCARTGVARRGDADVQVAQVQVGCV